MEYIIIVIKNKNVLPNIIRRPLIYQNMLNICYHIRCKGDLVKNIYIYIYIYIYDKGFLLEQKLTFLSFVLQPERDKEEYSLLQNELYKIISLLD